MRSFSRWTLIKVSALLIVITALGGGYLLNSYPEAAAANSLVRLNSPKEVAAPTANTSNTLTATNASSRATIVPNCTPSTSFSQPTAPMLNSNQPGLQRIILPNASYTVYGNSVSQISAQMATCTPISASDGDRFAASTDYAIDWNFSYQDTGNGLCTVTSASVGITIAEIYPSWQSSASAPAGLASSWRTFITNLATHEAGHAALDQTATSNILADLQNFPATDCSNISQAANAKANAEIVALDQANDAYDATTNHGTTQGAVLR